MPGVTPDCTVDGDRGLIIGSCVLILVSSDLSNESICVIHYVYKQNMEIVV